MAAMTSQPSQCWSKSVLCLAYRCIIDRQQKQFDAESCRLLCNFAEVVVQEILKYDARVRLITCSCTSYDHA